MGKGKPQQQPAGASCEKKQGSFIGTLLWITVVASLVVAFLVAVNLNATHVFDPAVMQQIAREAISEHNGNADNLIASVVSKLRAKYPEHIMDNAEWMFNNAGGAMGSMLVLHCSLSEYVIIFGTALGTEGHTGRFFADDYFTILHGEQWAYAPGNLSREVYQPGDQHHLPWGVAKQYRMDDTCWALEYARGSIVSMMPFGFWDTLFSTLDLPTLFQTVRVSAVGMISQILKGKI